MGTDTSAGPAPDAQPPEGGQGPEATAEAGLYDLSQAPEELRPYLEAELKKIEGNVTRKFQEHADVRKRMEALEQAGLPSDMAPEDISHMVGMFQTISDPEAFEEFWYRAGEELGYFADDEEGGEVEGDGSDVASDTSVDQIAQHILSQIDERLGPIEEQMSQQEAQAREAEAAEEIRQELAELHEKHGDFDEDAVCELALNYEGPDALERGYMRLQEILGGNEKSWFNDRDGPRQMQGGESNTAAEPVTDFDTAKRLARERLAGSR